MTRSTSVHCQSSQVRSDNLIICSLSIWLMVTRYKGAAAPVEWWMAWCLTEAEAVCPLHSSSPTWSPSSHLCQCWDPGQVSGRDSRSTLRRLCYRYSHFTPHADFGTKVLLSWRFYKLKPLMPYLNGETCIGNEKRQHRRGKYRSQKARSPSGKRFPTSGKKPHISFQVIPRGLKSGGE